MTIPRQPKPPRLPNAGSSRPPGNSNSRPNHGNSNLHPGNRCPPYRRYSPFARRPNGNNKSGFNRQDTWKGNAGRHGGQFVNRGYGNGRNNLYVNNECVSNYHNDQGRSFHQQSRYRPSGG